MRFWGSLGRLFFDLLSWTDETITCPTCGGRAAREAVWGRFTEYRCPACGKSTKVKTYD